MPIWIDLDTGLKCQAESHSEAFLKILKMCQKRGIYKDFCNVNNLVIYGKQNYAYDYRTIKHGRR